MSDPSGDRLSVRRVFEIKNRLGLHARAASQFVQAVAKYDAEINVRKDDQVVNGKSIISLMMLAAGPGTEIEVSADGPDALAAVDVLESLIANKFNEE